MSSPASSPGEAGSPPVLDRPSRVPWPPVLLLVLVAAGWLLGRTTPLPWPAPPLGDRLGLAGLMLIAAGLLLELTVAREFTRASTTVMPHRAASALVTGGPFRYSRNPIYVAHVSLLAGLGFLRGNGWWLVLAPVLLIALDRLAIVREERHLEARFGDAYREYRSRVRRWM